MKTTVVYHSADYDGIFCREIARKFLPDAELIGWNFGDAHLPQPTSGSGHYVVMDLPIDRVFGVRFEDGWIASDNPIMSHDERQIQPLDRCNFSNITWIDHHKTSIDTHPNDIPGYRIDGVAACRLAWQWFVKHNELPTSFHNGVLSVKEEFIEHRVSEPLAVRLAGEYDVWDKRDPDAETFQFALRAEPLTHVGWAALLDDDRSFVDDLLIRGRVCQRYAQSVDFYTCKSRTWLMEWEGLKFLCVNTARFNSLFFAARDIPETGHDALLGFCWTGKCWTVSLYHASHRKDLDLSEIAKKHGGGGHRGACGFTCNELPFTIHAQPVTA